MEDVREECTMQNIVTEIETMFCDEEYGFEVYALINHFIFEKLTSHK